MHTRHLVSGLVVLSFGVAAGGMAYAGAPASVGRPLTVATGQSAGPVTLAAIYDRIAWNAAHSRTLGLARLPGSLRTPAGRPVRLYNTGRTPFTPSPEGPGLLARPGAGYPVGEQQAAVSGRKSDLCATPGDSCSTNWSGREDWGQTFTGVGAQWTVPVSAPTANPNGAAGTYDPEDVSTWIGLDGDPTFDDNNQPSLVQVGTDSPSQGSTTDGYEAWYELLPGFEVPLFAVNAGDSIQAVITETAADTWDIGIEDTSTGAAWAASGIHYNSPGATAEWIEEATTLCGTSASQCNLSQLQDFGAVNFTNMEYATELGADAPSVPAGTGSASRSIFITDQNGDILDYPVMSSGSAMTITEGAPGAFPGTFNAMAVDPSSGDVFVSSTGTASSPGAVTEFGPDGVRVASSASLPGAAGVAVTGGDVYVLDDAGLQELSEAGLAVVNTYAGVPAGADLVPVDGALWTASGSNLTEITTTGTATTFSVASAGDGVLSDPADSEILFTYGSSSVNEINVSSATLVIPAVNPDGGSVSDISDAAVSSDGSALTVTVAALSPGDEFPGFSVGSDLQSQTVVYPGATYPRAVATTPAQGGLFAGAVNGNGLGAATVFVYQLDTPTNLLIEHKFSSSVAYTEPAEPAVDVPPGGLAFAPDGSNLYVVTEGGDGSYALNVLATAAPAPSTGLGELTGQVTFESAGVGNVCVFAFGLGASTATYESVTQADGDYYIDDVTPGDYVAEFDPTCEGTVPSNYSTQFYGGVPDYGSALDHAVAVSAATVTPNIDALLVPGGAIEGTVSDQDSTGLPGVCVYAWAFADGYEVGQAITGANGHYEMTNLPTTQYLLSFDPTCGGTEQNPAPDAIEWWAGEGAPGTATPVNGGLLGTASTATAEADIALDTQATISGVVTAPGAFTSAGICVGAYSSAGIPVAFGVTGGGGEFTIGNLPGADYIVYFDPTCTGTPLGVEASDYAPQYYPDVSQVDAPDAAIVTVGTGGTTALATESLALASNWSPLAIGTAPLSAGAVGTSYFSYLTAYGGIPGWTWTVSGLPAGLSTFDGLPGDSCAGCGGGVIVGTPTQGGTFALTVTATDASNPPMSATAHLEIDVSGGGGGATTTTTTTAPIGGGGGGAGGLPPTTTLATTTTTTAPTPGTAPPSTSTTMPRSKGKAHATPRLSAVGGRATLKKGLVWVKLTCGPQVACAGSATLTFTTGKGRSAHELKLAAGPWYVPAGKAKTVGWVETVAGIKFLRGHHNVAARLEVVLRGGNTTNHQVLVP
ncbi:MAG TPA: hypothetical protein VME46_26505 [Acidimicrobiales bacterium]|nr:hypothetical protein [Acidimicrobiales bacterium]